MPVAVRVNPTNVTLETNQLIHFRAHGRNSAGDSVGAAVTWSTSGGTILPDGRFSAAAVGTYTVTGRTRARGETYLDSSVVTVVRRPALLVSVEVSPTSASLTPGATQNFVALGRLQDGSVVPIGVNWTAAGGMMDPAGAYVAGNIAGTYHVIATNTSGTLADTATVTISAPASTLARIVMRPGGAITLAPAATKQFRVFGRTTTGDSVAVTPVVFTATGGTVTPTGLYTAGSTPGVFRIIATSGTLADTTQITVTVSLPSGGARGVPFGPFNAWDGTSLKPNVEQFNLLFESYTALNIIPRIEIARARGVKQIVAMTGGARAKYLTDGVFDMAKWKARMQEYNTPEIKAAVAAAVADGTIIGESVMDEPGNVGGPGNEANSWGPPGTLNKARVDSMCAYVKGMFPTLPVGVFHDWRTFDPNSSYKTCDFVVSQYRTFKGDVTAYRDGGIALGRRDGHHVLFSLNIIDGGIKDNLSDGVWNCPVPLTGGLGSYAPNCRMTPDQVREFGRILGPPGCGLVMWRYADDFMANPENKRAFQDVADFLATQPAKSCRR